jgi:hypothetical protein
VRCDPIPARDVDDRQLHDDARRPQADPAQYGVQADAVADLGCPHRERRFRLELVATDRDDGDLRRCAHFLFVNLLLAIAAAYGAILFGIWLRELRAFVTSFVRTLFFLAPGLVPLAETREDVRDLLRLNPLTGLFEAYRDVFMNGTRPELWELVFPAIAALVLLAIFVPLYRSEQRQFAKVI